MDIRKLLFNNWGIKLLSLALSLTLWFYVTSKGKTEMTVEAPLELRNIPQNTAVVGDVIGSLEVRVQGQERALRDITTGKKVFGVLDLSMARIGDNTIDISPDDIRKPSGVTVVHLSRTDLRVKLEPLIRRTFRLKPILYGSPAPGYRVVKLSISPSKITVEGPDSVVRNVESVQTMPINIQAADQRITVEPKIDYQGRQFKILEKDIAVRISIEKAAR